MSQQPEHAEGDICWIEFPATDMERCKKFYSTVFGWEFSKPPGMGDCPASEEPPYVMFTKPGTQLHGGVMRVKEAEMIKPQVDAEGKGQSTNRLTMKVGDVDAALKAIEAAGGSIICGKKEIPGGMGFYGAFRDTEGNLNGVWSKK